MCKKMTGDDSIVADAQIVLFLPRVAELVQNVVSLYNVCPSVRHMRVLCQSTLETHRIALQTIATK